MQNNDQDWAIYRQCLKTLEEAEKERLKRLDDLRRERDFLINPVADETRKEERAKDKNAIAA
jgi:hypothetical protein